MSWLKEETERAADAHAAQRREIEELRAAHQSLLEMFRQLCMDFRELQERIEGDGK